MHPDSVNGTADEFNLCYQIFVKECTPVTWPVFSHLILKIWMGFVL